MKRKQKRKSNRQTGKLKVSNNLSQVITEVLGEPKVENGRVVGGGRYSSWKLSGHEVQLILRKFGQPHQIIHSNDGTMQLHDTSTLDSMLLDIAKKIQLAQDQVEAVEA